MRLTKIVATLGPASSEEPVLRAMVRAGLDVARLNFSHGDSASHGRLVARLRRASRAEGRPVALLQDLQGPRLRLGRLPAGCADEAGNLRLDDGAAVILARRGARVPRGAIALPVESPALARDVRRGQRLLLRDGRVELRVESVRDGAIACVVARGGEVRDRCGINAPDTRLRVPALTAKDRADLAIGARLRVDAVALSFVRDAADLELARRELLRLGRRPLLVAKVERPEAIENLDAILRAADGVMVARGDLGVELGPEAVPLLQKEIIRDAIRSHSFVITATQMLESMTSSATPTRAEVSDVANAILDGTDAVMLSAESATGCFPVEAIATLDRIARHVERRSRPGHAPQPPASAPAHDFIFALAGSAVALAEQAGAAALLPFTVSGRTASIVATYRPQLPIVAYTASDATVRRLCFWRGVHARHLAQRDGLRALFAAGVRDARAAGLLASGDVAVLIGGHALARGGSNVLQLVRVAGGRGTAR